MLFFQQTGIVVRFPRITSEILARPELQRVDKNADHQPVSLCPGLPDQVQVTFVQVTHGRHQADRMPLAFPLGDLALQRRDGINNVH